jgi:hypothetical protein
MILESIQHRHDLPQNVQRDISADLSSLDRPSVRDQLGLHHATIGIAESGPEVSDKPKGAECMRV